jgi:hypothetical protein
MPSTDDFTFLWFWLLSNAEDLRNIALLAALLSVPPFVAWRAWLNHQAEKRAAAKSHSEERSREAERLAKVFAQLGSEQIAVRIAAVHTLEQIARDQPRQHGAIMQTLGAFVREQAKAPSPRLVGDHYEAPDPADIYVAPRTDVQAALAVLGRRQREHDRTIDKPVLAGTNLSGYDLSDGDFVGASFRGSYLCGAVLAGAQLTAANFDYAVLERADLFGADCMGASFVGAVAPGARFAHARLDNAQLLEADLRSVDFTRARLDGAGLDNANLDGALLDEVSGLPHPTVALPAPDPAPTLTFKSQNRQRV